MPIDKDLYKEYLKMRQGDENVNVPITGQDLTNNSDETTDVSRNPVVPGEYLTNLLSPFNAEPEVNMSRPGDADLYQQYLDELPKEKIVDAQVPAEKARANVVPKDTSAAKNIKENVNPLSDLSPDIDRLSELREQKRKIDLLRGLNLASQQIGSGFAAQQGGFVQPNKQLDSLLKEKIQDPETQYLKEQMNNPKSTISEFARNMAKKQVPSNIAEKLNNMSAAELKKLGFKGAFSQAVSEYQRRALELRKEANEIAKAKLPIQMRREDVRAGRLQTSITRDMERDRREAQRAVEKDPRWSAAIDIETFSPQAKTLIKSAERGDETALATLGVKVAKALGEKGVLTDKDVTRYTEAASWLERAKSLGYKAAAAKITPDVKDSLIRMFSEFDDIAKNLKNKVYREKAQLFAKAQNIDYEDARFMIDPYYEKPDEYDYESDRNTIKEETSFLKTVEGLDNEKDISFKPKEPEVSRVKVILPNGKRGTIDASTLDEFKKQYPEATIVEE